MQFMHDPGRNSFENISSRCMTPSVDLHKVRFARHYQLQCHVNMQGNFSRQ
eukprot:Awhi_evm1s3764